jgi:DNA-binding transcriptional regulator YiaG
VWGHAEGIIPPQQHEDKVVHEVIAAIRREIGIDPVVFAKYLMTQNVQVSSLPSFLIIIS